MVALVKFIGIVMVVAGAIYLVQPEVMKKVMFFWIKGKWIYLGGVLSILIGIIFLLVARRCTLPGFVFLMGILSLIKGAVAFALGPKKIVPLIEKLSEGSLATLRILAAISLGLGVLLIYSA